MKKNKRKNTYRESRDRRLGERWYQTHWNRHSRGFLFPLQGRKKERISEEHENAIACWSSRDRGGEIKETGPSS